MARKLFFRGVAPNITFALEHIEYTRSRSFEAGVMTLSLLSLLAVADAGEHITQWISKCHIR